MECKIQVTDSAIDILQLLHLPCLRLKNSPIFRQIREIVLLSLGLKPIILSLSRFLLRHKYKIENIK